MLILRTDQHWGHATSPDLYHWTNQKIALWPYNETNYVFSGGAIVDANNDSGMFPDQDNGVIAFYTIANYPEEGIGYQTTNIAFSHDDGYTFETYAENPIINPGSDQYRDPQVVWHEGSVGLVWHDCAHVFHVLIWNAATLGHEHRLVVSDDRKHYRKVEHIS